MDFVLYWAEKTGIATIKIVCWLKLAPSKFYDWKKRYGKMNHHNGWIPRDTWLEDWEREAIIRFYSEHPTEGYRRATFMMLDQDIVAVSPSTTYRVLKEAGLLGVGTGPAREKAKALSSPRPPMSTGMWMCLI